MDYELDKSHLEIQQAARELATRVEPIAFEADEMSRVHVDVLAALKDSGLCKLMVTSEYGGLNKNIDPLAICLVREAFMASSAHLDALFAMQGIGSFAITKAGSKEQKTTWLEKVGNAEALAALALTEPEAGSDLKSIKSTIEETEDGLLLNGVKAFISNGGDAAFYEVFARDGEAYSMILVPADAKGVSVIPTPEIMAPHILGDIYFDNVMLDKSARIGAKGQGMSLVLSTLSTFRVSVAAAAVGLAQAALEEAARHSLNRHQFGRPLYRLGPVSQMLADCRTEIEMSRLITYKAAYMAAEDPKATLQLSSMAKLAATETASKVVDRCVQIMGRFGLVRNSKIEKYYRQARPMRIYEGASEVLRLGIASELVEKYK